MRRLSPVILAATALAAAAARAAPAERHAPLWTKTYAEAVLLLELRLPCKQVRTAAECRVADARKRLALFDRQAAACRSSLGSKAGTCTTAAVGADPKTNLDDVEHGFPIRTVHCVGGAPGKGVRRFSTFRCRITVHDDANPFGPVVVSGRLLISVTGTTTFHWQAI